MSKFLSIGIVAGLVCALADVVAVIGQRGSDVTRALPYALVVDVLAGAIFGVVLLLTALAGRALSRSNQWLTGLPFGLLAAAAFIYLNLTTLDGPQISQHARIGVFRIALFGVMPLGIIGAFILAARLLQLRSRVPRVLIGCAAAGAIVVCTWGGLHVLNAYPMLKMQMALVVMAAAAFLVHMVPWRSGGRTEAILCVVILALATVGGHVLRRGTAIHRTRATIIDTPLPTTFRATLLIEDLFLRRLAPLASIDGDGNNGGAVITLEAARDSKHQRVLDETLPERRKFNVIWIAIDALRADHVGCYGYGRPTSPRLDELAGRSVRFAKAVTPTPSSALTYSSVLTGLFARVSRAYEIQHGIDFNLPDDRSIAHAMKSAGRRTLGLTSFHQATQSQPMFTPMADGFDEFNTGRGSAILSGMQVTDRALVMLDEHEAYERPFFMFLHYMDPHGPYDFNDDFRFGDRPIDAYDGEIALADREIGRLLDGLKARGLDDETIVMVFADHGEAFGEHNNRQHGGSLYQHQIHVPLIIHVPTLEPRVVDQWVSLSGLVPTTFALLGLGDPHRRLGRDLVPLMLGDASEWVDAVYSERPAPPRNYPPSLERSICSGNLKLIWKPHEQTFQVFDLVADPAESKNLYDPNDPLQRELRRLMRAWDEHIDSYVGTAAVAHHGPDSTEGGTEPSTRPTEGGESEQSEAASMDVSFVATFSRGVEALATASGEGIEAALKSLDDLIEGPAIDRDPIKRSRLESESLVRLKVLVERILPDLPTKAPSRVSALSIMTFLEDPSLLPLARAETERGGGARTLLEILAFRARMGDREVLPPLEAGLAVLGPTTDRILMAESLAHLGSDAGRDLMRAGLEIANFTLLNSSIRGLGAIGDPQPLYNLLFSESRVWRNKSVIGAVLPQAMTDTTARGTAALMRIAAAGYVEDSAKARAELERRLSPELLARSDHVYEVVFGARDAIRYRKFANAVKSLESCTPADDVLLGPSWWLLARAAWETKEYVAVERAIDRLDAATAGDAEISKLVERMRRHRGGPARLPARKMRLQAQLVGEPAIDAVRQGRFFFARVKITNSSDAFIAGGHWRDGVQFGFAFDAKGKDTALPRVTAPLPLSGLEPGESTTLIVIGQFPKRQGEHTPRLALTTGPEAKLQGPLLDLPPVNIE